MESPTTEQGSPAISGFGSGTVVGVEVEVGVGVGVGVGVAEGFGAATATPLFHISFLPLFTHVYFLPPDVMLCPALLQTLPAFGAVAAWATEAIKTKESSTGNRRITFLIPKLYVITMTKTIT
jgi:hypothetical protein